MKVWTCRPQLSAHITFQDPHSPICQIQSGNFGYQGILLNTGPKVALLGDDEGHFLLPEIHKMSEL
jgi:hypothetical protein